MLELPERHHLARLDLDDRRIGPGEGQQPSQARQLRFVECGSEQVRRAFATRSTAGRFQGCVPTFRRAQLRERPTPPEATLSLLAFAIGQSINAQGDAKRAYFDARPHNDPTSAVKLLSHKPIDPNRDAM